RRSPSEHPDAPKAINDIARNVRLSIYLHRIDLFVEKLPKFDQRLVQLGLLRRRDAWVRHHPIGNEMTQEKPLRKTKRLWPRKKQFLCLLNFFLSLCVEFVHETVARQRPAPPLCCVFPCVQSRAMSVP